MNRVIVNDCYISMKIIKSHVVFKYLVFVFGIILLYHALCVLETITKYFLFRMREY